MVKTWALGSPNSLIYDLGTGCCLVCCFYVMANSEQLEVVVCHLDVAVDCFILDFYNLIVYWKLFIVLLVYVSC